MTSRLFRPEVAQARQEEWLGSVRLTNPKVGWPIATAVSALALSLVLFLIFGEYTRSEQVRGQLVPSKGLIPILANTTGTVVRTYVHEGQSVDQRQPLLEISADRDNAAVGQIGAAVAAELESQRARLQQELEELDELANRERQKLQRSVSTLRRQLELTDAQLAIREQQLASTKAMLERIAPVRHSGQLTALQLQQYESQALEAEAQYEMAKLQRITAAQELAETESELQELPIRMTDLRHDLERSLAELTQAIARNEGERSLVIRAHRAGLISGLNITDGQSVVVGQILLAIIPEGSELHAELWVPADAVGRIEPGGRVAMRYHAYPYQQFGQQYGTIIEIAHRALTPEEVRQSSGMDVDAPVYRVRVKPEQQVIHADGATFALRTNMTLDAALLLDRRRLIEMLGLRLPGDTPITENEVLAQLPGAMGTGL